MGVVVFCWDFNVDLASPRSRPASVGFEFPVVSASSVAVDISLIVTGAAGIASLTAGPMTSVASTEMISVAEKSAHVVEPATVR